MQPITAEQFEDLVGGDAGPETWWDPDAMSDFDKCWRELYHLLVDGAEDNPPRVAKAITGDVLVADDEMDYAPPFGEIIQSYTLPDGSKVDGSAPGLGAISPGLVKQIAADLAALGDDEVRRRATYVRVPGTDRTLVSPGDVEYCITNLHGLREFYEGSANTDSAVVVMLE